MTRAMKLRGAFLLVGLVGCVQLPAVSVRMRASFAQGELHARRSLEARVDCGWALDSSAARMRGAAAEREPEPSAPWLEPDLVTCDLARACAWELRERGAALAALVPEANSFSEGEAP
jgi:hypothetical protein